MKKSDRIKLIREKFCNNSNVEFANKVGVKPTQSSNWTNDKYNVGEIVLKKILYAFPNINPTWLLTGEGEMLNNQENKQKKDTLTDDLTINNPNSSTGGKMVPFFDVNAMAGSGADMTAVTNPTSMINVGDMLFDSEAAMSVYGNSMLPGYPPGCIVGLRPWNDNYIKLGEVYVLETNSDRHLKRLYLSDDKQSIICLSDNTVKHESGPFEGKYCYPPFEVPFSSIIRMWIVTGCIKRNTSGIVNRSR